VDKVAGEPEPGVEESGERDAEQPTGLAVRVRRIQMSDDSWIDIPAQGVLVLVGPNNAGKSLTLRDIHARLRNNVSTHTTAIRQLELEREGDGEALMRWLDENYSTVVGPSKQVVYRSSDGDVLNSGLAQEYWSQPRGLDELTEFFVLFASASTRLQSVGPENLPDLRNEAPTHPLHRLFMDRDLERAVSAAFLEAFGEPLLLERVTNKVRLLVGELPEGVDQWSTRDAFAETLAMPPLEEQGDGMKSFMGLLLYLVVSAYLIVLVDEPEAFLHPPQARLLGEKLSKQSAASQVIVATHDSDVLRGMLNSPERSVSVVRLVRDGDVNQVSQLTASQVRTLWSDPLLRYSNILDALFHDLVVLCEGDADCSYYSAILDDLLNETARPTKPQVLFTQCGGKSRMPTVIKALTAVNVPVNVVADFDVLREEDNLRRIVEALGGKWDELKTSWGVLKSQLDGLVSPVRLDDAKRRLDELLKGESPFLQPEQARRARDVLRSQTGWDRTKSAGIAAVPAGDSSNHCKRLIEALETIGLFVVPVGEVEGFEREVGLHGPGWLAGVFERRLHENRTNRAPRDFLRRVVPT
jgi:hypothetical protein